MALIYKTLGAVGLIFICTGVMTKTRKKQDILYIIGGICLEFYSIYLGDLVFIVLQIVFILTASYDLLKNTKKKKIKKLFK
jgi:lipid-A-disaccharide synthase-like uncharacterized protein